ncbi:MAG: hypothetical protein M3O31_14380 [Acidobacteriota bacterium]|nr:hypothetical protein [Acidobacteriota bacterium]
MRHIQLEPVWGGSADTAGTLRGTCALALVQCRELDSHGLLIHLIPLLADKELPVRVDAVRAVVQVGSDSAALLLRLRAELGSDEPELLGSCYSGVLALEGPGAIPWAARFLLAEDDAAGEAAMAIAQTHTPEAFQLLRTTFAKHVTPGSEPPFSLRSLLFASRKPPAGSSTSLRRNIHTPSMPRKPSADPPHQPQSWAASNNSVSPASGDNHKY